MENKKIDTRKIAVTAVMAALSTVLMILEFNIPLVPSFLKFDFSDLPAIITSFAFGPLCGVSVELVKNLIHLLFTHTGGVGELANFLVGSAFVFPAGLIYKHKKSRKGALIGALVGMLVSATVSFPVNYFITYPFYMGIMPEEVIVSMYKALIPPADTLTKALLIVNIPFTAFKGALNSLITFLVYKKISPILKSKNKH